MKIRTLLLSFIAMLLFMPYSFAFSWKDDVDAAAQDISKIYEVYPRMPYGDFESAWSDVPGWTCLSRNEDVNNELQIKQAIFRKNEIGNDGVVEEFHVFYGNNRVISTSLWFKSEDEKMLNRIFNYALVRYNGLTNQHKKRKYYAYNNSLENFIFWRTFDDLNGEIFIAISLVNNNKGRSCVIINETDEFGQD